MKRVSIVLLSYNNERDTFRCLSSLVKVDYPDFEVVVVDNGSNEKSASKLKGHVNKLKQGFKVRNVQLSSNRGFAGGCNAGVRDSKSDYVVLLNNDTTVNKGYLKEMVKVMESEDNVAIVGSRIVNEGSYEAETTFGGLLHFTGSPIKPPPGMPDYFTFVVSGCSMLLNKKVVGLPFDEDYFMYGEDVYLSWLSLLRGYKCVIATKSVVKHRSLYDKHRNRSFNVAFHGSKNAVLNVLIFLSWLTFLRSCLFCLFKICLRCLGILLEVLEDGG